MESRNYTLTLHTNGQNAQKSHGLCPPGKPDVANLPAGEVYFVPESAEGTFPFKYNEGTVGLLHVKDGKIYKSQLVYGDYAMIEDHNRRLSEDPMIGAIGELGLEPNTPFSGRDIQDEKSLAPYTWPLEETTISEVSLPRIYLRNTKTPPTMTFFTHRTKRQKSDSRKRVCIEMEKLKCSSGTMNLLNT